MMRTKIELTKKKWVDDFLEDVNNTRTRLIGTTDVKAEKVNQATKQFVKEIASDFYEISIKSYNG